jgi:hypothetical protein
MAKAYFSKGTVIMHECGVQYRSYREGGYDFRLLAHGWAVILDCWLKRAVIFDSYQNRRYSIEKRWQPRFWFVAVKGEP